MPSRRGGSIARVPQRRAHAEEVRLPAGSPRSGSPPSREPLRHQPASAYLSQKPVHPMIARGERAGRAWGDVPCAPASRSSLIKAPAGLPAPGGPDHPDHQGAVKLTVARNVPIASASLARVQIPMDRGQRSERSRSTRWTGLKRPPLKSFDFSVTTGRGLPQSPSLKTRKGGA
jgi:hypothetical protein